MRYDLSSVNIRYVVTDPTASSAKDPQSVDVTWSDLDMINMGKFNPTGDIETLKDERAVIRSIMNILYTKPGEMVHLPEFGCDLDLYIFKMVVNDANASILGATIKDAITRWEKRVSAPNISVFPDINGNRWLIDIKVTVRALNRDVSISGISISKA